jgi:adenylate cyclase
MASAELYPQESAAARASNRGRSLLSRNLAASIILLMIVLAGLPIAVWLDLRSLSEAASLDQANSLISMIDSVRSYYAENIVGRVEANGGAAHVTPDYLDTPGSIPIPATLSLELGGLISKAGGDIKFRFFSDYPFKNRAPHAFDAFERQALATLRSNPSERVYDISGSIFDQRIHVVTPILMAAPCVSCHNSDPNSPKRDWKIGDVRGIEEFTIRQTVGARLFAFKYLIAYFAFVAATGLAFIWRQHRQYAVIERINRELARANASLASVAQKIAKYLSPQHSRSIFSGERDVLIATERKKLTIFFSDVVDFTATAERLQPEELTSILNEYLTAMSQIATSHGGTVNKFIGDAILVFFGDPESRGVAEDAKACLEMAFAMQERLAELNSNWRRRGVEEPFRARMGINTGFVTVGNFGSDDHMDYTIIGAEANLAARLQTIAEPGGIVLSYETYSLVRRYVRARPLAAITLKGVSAPIIPYAIDGRIDAPNEDGAVINVHGGGLDLFVDVGALDLGSADRVRQALEDAASAIKHKWRAKARQARGQPTTQNSGRSGIERLPEVCKQSHNHGRVAEVWKRR